MQCWKFAPTSRTPCRILLSCSLADFEQPEGYDHQRRVPQYKESLPNGTSYLTLDVNSRSSDDNTGVFSVPQGHCFMMGDNRDNSMDSRFPNVGYVPAVNLINRGGCTFLRRVPPVGGRFGVGLRQYASTGLAKKSNRIQSGLRQRGDAGRIRRSHQSARCHQCRYSTRLLRVRISLLSGVGRLQPRYQTFDREVSATTSCCADTMCSVRPTPAWIKSEQVFHCSHAVGRAVKNDNAPLGVIDCLR